MQSILCKPYIFSKQPKIARQCTPGRDLWWKVVVLGITDGEWDCKIGCMVEDNFFPYHSCLVQST